MPSSAERPTVEPRFFREKGFAGEIGEIAEPIIGDLGFRLVRVSVSGRDGGTVQIMADHPKREINVDDCTRISRELESVFDACGRDLRSSHRLEISSPGIDRPIVRQSDIDAHAGDEAKVELKQAIDGRKKFRGQLEGYVNNELRLIVDVGDGAGPQVLGFALELIDSAKLVLTDQLIEKALARQKAHEKSTATR